MTHVFKKYDRVRIKMTHTADVNKKTLLEMEEGVAEQVFIILLLNDELLPVLKEQWMKDMCRTDGTVLIVHENDFERTRGLSSFDLFNEAMRFFSHHRVYMRAPNKLVHATNKDMKSKLDSYNS